MYVPVCREIREKRSMSYASNDNNDADLHLQPLSQPGPVGTFALINTQKKEVLLIVAVWPREGIQKLK